MRWPAAIQTKIICPSTFHKRAGVCLQWSFIHCYYYYSLFFHTANAICKWEFLVHLTASIFSLYLTNQKLLQVSLYNYIKTHTSLSDFDSPTLEGRLFWASEIDIPLVGMETDSCKFTSCPIVKNEKRTYNFTLPISRKFPAVRHSYPI